MKNHTNFKLSILAIALGFTSSLALAVDNALTDSNGRVISFTDLSGRVLAFAAPNGTPVSSVFGPGATGATLL